MRQPAIMFRLPGHVLENLEALAQRLKISVNLVAKLIVTREVMHIPAMLDEHDCQLANMHQFLRELAFRNEEYLSDEVRTEAMQAVTEQLEAVMTALDAIRDAAFVRPSTHISDLIREHDERYVQSALAI